MTDTAATLALVEAGVGVSVVTDLMLRPRPSRLDVLELRETMERHIVVVFRSFAEHRPTVAALVDVAGSAGGMSRTLAVGKLPRDRCRDEAEHDR